jgi:hypothetical protein
MIGPMAVIGIWAALRPVQATVGWLLNSIGDAGLVGGVSAAVMIPFIVGVVVAAQRGGITTVAWVVVAEVTVNLVALAVLVHRRAGVTIAQQWSSVRPVALGCALAWAVANTVSAAVESAPALLALVASAGAGALAYVGAVALLAPGVFGYALARGRAMVGARPVTPPETP